MRSKICNLLSSKNVVKAISQNYLGNGVLHLNIAMINTPNNYIQYLIQSHLAKYVGTGLLHLMLVHLIAIGWWSKNHLGRHTQTSDADFEHNKMPSIAVLFVAQVHYCDIHKRCRMARVLSRQWF